MPLIQQAANVVEDLPAGSKKAGSLSISDRSVRMTALFASFVFLQFTTLGLANHAGEGFLNTEQRELIYYVLQVFVILGFLLHAFFTRLLAGTKRSGMEKVIGYT
ncbi:MAG: hypothetical protein J5966_07480, partial [Lachnospiraceae bacterium]|nr:hypothetical protein [Lachnospiraceae bacterium]